MKFSIHLSNTSLIMMMGLILGILLLTDIHAHRTDTMTTPQSGTADKVVTKEFVLVDDNGNTRARIGMNDVGSPCLQLFDRQGQQRAQLRLNQDDIPSLRLYDANGMLRTEAGFCLNTMEPEFILFDTNGNGTRLLEDPGDPKHFVDEDLVRKGQVPLHLYFNEGEGERVYQNDIDITPAPYPNGY